MEILIHELRNLLMDAAELGAKKALINAGKLKPYLKKSEAYRLYGRSVIDRWIEERLITPRKDGDYSATWRIDRIELEAVAKASNRTTYLSVNERGKLK
jgi:hypothetical protein